MTVLTCMCLRFQTTGTCYHVEPFDKPPPEPEQGPRPIPPTPRAVVRMHRRVRSPKEMSEEAAGARGRGWYPQS